jgi:hypothetical protein
MQYTDTTRCDGRGAHAYLEASIVCFFLLYTGGNCGNPLSWCSCGVHLAQQSAAGSAAGQLLLEGFRIGQVSAVAGVVSRCLGQLEVLEVAGVAGAGA